MICPTTPFYSGHLEDYLSSWVSRSPSLPSMWTTGPFSPLLGLSFPPIWWPWCLLCPGVPCSGCCEHNAGQGSRGHEGHKQAPGLRGPGQRPTSERDVPTELELQASPWPLGHALSSLVPSSPATRQSGHAPAPVGEGWTPKQHRPLFPSPPPPEGLDFSFWTVCIETQWCQIKPRQGPGPLLVRMK